MMSTFGVSPEINGLVWEFLVGYGGPALLLAYFVLTILAGETFVANITDADAQTSFKYIGYETGGLLAILGNFMLSFSKEWEVWSKMQVSEESKYPVPLDLRAILSLVKF